MNKKVRKNMTETTYFDDENFLHTYDLGCAAALLSKNCIMIYMDKTDPRKVKFIFDKDRVIHKIVEDYWLDRLNVKARTYFNNIKMIKTRIYSLE